MRLDEGLEHNNEVGLTRRENESLIHLAGRK